MTRYLWPVVMLLAAVPTWPQLLQQPERTVEIMLAESSWEGEIERIEESSSFRFTPSPLWPPIG